MNNKQRPEHAALRRKVLNWMTKKGKPQRPRDVVEAFDVSPLTIGGLINHAWFDRVGKGLYQPSTAGVAALEKEKA
jgi:hypothetical protein